MSDEDQMGRMGPQRFDELREAYALDALSEEERREFERYLAENPSERAEVDELSSIAALLSLAPPEQEPPASLRKSLMDQVRAEAGESTAGRGAISGRRNWVRWFFGARGIATAAAAAAILGLAVWNVSLQSEVREMRDAQDVQMSSYELQGSGEAEATHGELVRIGSQGAMLVASDLPELPEGKTYEMWTIDEGRPSSCGIFEAGEGPAIEAIRQPISDAEQFAITVEPEGGSEQPTTEPIVIADLTRTA